MKNETTTVEILDVKNITVDTDVCAEAVILEAFCSDGCYYVLTVYQKREGIELFRKRDLTAEQPKIFNMFDGEEKSISLRCVNFLADVIINRFGKDVMMYADPNLKDHFITTVSVKESDQFYAWVASFGNKMKVIAPDEATRKMKNYIEKIYDLYKDEGKM